jgi:hypothetical protein
MSNSRSIRFRSASGLTMSHWADTIDSSRNTPGRTSILPASIFARSRMSLIISSSIRPDERMFCT